MLLGGRCFCQRGEQWREGCHYCYSVSSTHSQPSHKYVITWGTHDVQDYTHIVTLHYGDIIRPETEQTIVG